MSTEVIDNCLSLSVWREDVTQPRIVPFGLPTTSSECKECGDHSQNHNLPVEFRLQDHSSPLCLSMWPALTQ